nr:uncharacterized protein LOC125987506 [Syngnathus scovelli]
MRPRRICPEKEALEFISADKDKPTFQKRIINKEKGYGIIATKNMEAGEFLLEYVGRHVTGSEGEALFKQYSDTDAAFLYFYSFRGQIFCVDGSKHTARLGRFINDDHIKPNSKIRIILDKQKKPHLCAFAITKINKGEEIVYDYGDTNCPWRQVTTQTENCDFITPDVSEITGNDLVDSASPIEKEPSVSEMTSVQQLSLPLDISDATDDDDDDEDKDEQKDEDYIEEEEDDDDDDDEEEEEDDDEEAEKGGIYKEPPSKIPRKQVSLELDMSDKKEQLAELFCKERLCVNRTTAYRKEQINSCD